MRSRSRFFIVVLVATAAVLVRSIVVAEEPRVVLIGSKPHHPTLVRMRDELAVLGFAVELVEGDSRDLAAVARSRGAAAAARVEGSPLEVVLWVDPARTSGEDGGDLAGAELRVSEPASPGRPGSEPALLALRAVELLHGKLLRFTTGADAGAPSLPPHADAAPPDASAIDASIECPRGRPCGPHAAIDASPPPPRPVAITVGPAILLSPGGLSPMPHVRVGVEVDPVPRVGAELMAFIPTTPATARAPEGSVAVRVLQLGAGIRGALTDPAGDFSASVGLGLGAMLLIFAGDAAPPFVGVDGTRWVASPYLELAGSYRLHPRFALRVDVLGSLVRPEPVVRIAGRDVASFGQPAVFSSFGVEVRP